MDTLYWTLLADPAPIPPPLLERIAAWAVANPDTPTSRDLALRDELDDTYLQQLLDASPAVAAHWLHHYRGPTGSQQRFLAHEHNDVRVALAGRVDLDADVAATLADTARATVAVEPRLTEALIVGPAVPTALRAQLLAALAAHHPTVIVDLVSILRNRNNPQHVTQFCRLPDIPTFEQLLAARPALVEELADALATVDTIGATLLLGHRPQLPEHSWATLLNALHCLDSSDLDDWAVTATARLALTSHSGSRPQLRTFAQKLDSHARSSRSQLLTVALRDDEQHLLTALAGLSDHTLFTHTPPAQLAARLAALPDPDLTVRSHDTDVAILFKRADLTADAAVALASRHTLAGNYTQQLHARLERADSDTATDVYLLLAYLSGDKAGPNPWLAANQVNDRTLSDWIELLDQRCDGLDTLAEVFRQCYQPDTNDLFDARYSLCVPSSTTAKVAEQLLERGRIGQLPLPAIANNADAQAPLRALLTDLAADQPEQFEVFESLAEHHTGTLNQLLAIARRL